MLTQEQYKTVEDVLAIPVSAIRACSPEQFTGILQNTLDEMTKTDEVDIHETDSLPAAYEAHQVLQFVVNVLKILTEQIESVRNLTPDEQKLIGLVDRKIGQVCFRMVRLVQGLRQFEHMKNNLTSSNIVVQ